MSEPTEKSQAADQRTPGSGGGFAVSRRGATVWLRRLGDWVLVNWQAKLIALAVACLVWYLVRTYVDQDRGNWVPPDFHPGVATALTSPPPALTVRCFFRANLS